ncbi:DUF29 domain-containing protein [Endozoicomonas sp. ONNA1]|uniref:DUF29 domain-containing protein n=1 Tax=Endozoicomonas sp. ONNA1 TaxID=2828740 RepID=UPI00214928F6|nr:DUF29 domain-containing protein [Endozoicomonas sp. ONNA1]
MKSLYESDYYTWACQQTQLIREGKFNELDLENLIEEVDGLGGRHYDALEGALKQLLLHLLKWQMQSQKDDLHEMNAWYRSWTVTIDTQRLDAEEVLEKNPGLQSKIDEILATAYQNARKRAAKAMGCKINDFPTECPWSFEQIMTEDWLPE